MRPFLPLIAVGALALTPASLFALATETVGYAPAVKQPGWADGVLEVVNLRSRVYSQWVNGNENFFFQGDRKALNEALRKYAGVKDDKRDLILLPGPGKTQTFAGKQIDFNWRFHVPTGIYKAMTQQRHAVMTVYVNAAKPRGTAGKERVEKWIGELDADSFETRQKAEQELRKVDSDAKPFLRRALKARPSPEARRRIEILLGRLQGIDVSDLEIPKELRVVGVNDLLAVYLKRLNDGNSTVSGLAAHELTSLVSYTDKVVPALIGLLAKDKNEYVRRVAASSLAHIGAEARSALPALKEGRDDPDVNVRASFRAAIAQIEKAKVQPAAEDEVKKTRAILKDITEMKKAPEEK